MPVITWHSVTDKLPALGVRVLATDGQMVGEAFCTVTSGSGTGHIASPGIMGMAAR